jgi:O-antigen ligase
MVTGRPASRRAVQSGLGRLLADPESLGRNIGYILCAFAAAIPLSIALAQTLLAAAVLLALRHWWIGAVRIPRTPLDGPLAAFLASTALAAVFGLDPVQAWWGNRTYLQVAIVYLVVAYAPTSDQVLALLKFFLAGMIVTSAHTVWNAVLPWALPDPFPGSMTESGQLLFAIGLSASLWLGRAAWPRVLPWTLLLHWAALVANLKRGVWLGALATMAVLGLLRSRRAILASVGAAALAIGLFPPVQARIGHTVRDFYMPGNRRDIWAAAVDVIRRFPMGVGRKNGTILRDYPNIPPRHKHAHNNLLQITMEFGILGLVTFLWWTVAYARLAWRTCRSASPEEPVSSAIAAAAFATFVGFHVAGLVEYNFGDTEVLEVFFLVMGAAIVVSRAAGAEERYGANGSSSTIVASRSGPTETIRSGTPVSSTTRSK